MKADNATICALVPAISQCTLRRYCLGEGNELFLKMNRHHWLIGSPETYRGRFATGSEGRRIFSKFLAMRP